MSSTPIFARDERHLSQQRTPTKAGQLVLCVLAVCCLSFLVAHATVRAELSGTHRAPGTATAHILVSDAAGASVHVPVPVSVPAAAAVAPLAPANFAPKAQQQLLQQQKQKQRSVAPQQAFLHSAETVGTLHDACVGAERCINGGELDPAGCNACKTCAATCPRMLARQCAYLQGFSCP